MPTPRPQAHYRQRLLQMVAANQPTQLLEVGCGGGGFLRSVAGLGIAIYGIDPDETSLEPLRHEGFDVRVGHAEQLDFPDQSFDAVVFCFTAHHIADWSQALSEALRVSRHGVYVLDPWYDTGIPSQAVAERFDSWSKSIDRAGGMIHHDCLSAGQLLAPIADKLTQFNISMEYLLQLQELGVTQLSGYVQAQLGKAAEPMLWKDESAAILQQAERAGFSDDGAVLLMIEKHSVT